MKKVFLAAFAALLLALTSCTVESVDKDIASKIVGTYTLTDYIFNTSPAVAGNTVVVTRIDDTHVDIAIDYSGSATGADLTVEEALVVEEDGKYDLSRTYSNADITGTVSGNTITIDMVYDDGDQVAIIGVKQ